MKSNINKYLRFLWLFIQLLIKLINQLNYLRVKFCLLTHFHAIIVSLWLKISPEWKLTSAKGLKIQNLHKILS